MNSTYVLTKLFFQNIIRDKFFSFVFFSGVLFGCFSIVLNEISYGATEMVIRSFSLGFLSVTMIFLSIFFGLSIISSEGIKNSIIMLICRPIRKVEIVISSTVAFLVALLVAELVILGEFYLIFSLYGLKIGVDFLYGLLGILFESMTIFGITLLFRNFLSPLIATIFVSSLYIFSHSARGLLELSFFKEKIYLKYGVEFLSRVFPDLTYFDFKHIVFNNVNYLNDVANGCFYFIVSFLIIIYLVCFIFHIRDFD